MNEMIMNEMYKKNNIAILFFKDNRKTKTLNYVILS